MNILKLFLFLMLTSAFASESSSESENQKYIPITTVVGVGAAGAGGLMHFWGVEANKVELKKIIEQDEQASRRARTIQMIRDSQAVSSTTPGGIIRMNRNLISQQGNTDYFILSDKAAKKLADKYGITKEDIISHQNSTARFLRFNRDHRAMTEKSIRDYRGVRNFLFVVSGISISASIDYLGIGSASDDSDRNVNNEKFDLSDASGSNISAAGVSER